MSEPQDVAEGLDEETLGTDPVTQDEFGVAEIPADLPYAVDEELVTEPITDSVASRDERLIPEAWTAPSGTLHDIPELDDGASVDTIPLVADPRHRSAEEDAIHLVEER
jgi:hypothetical protein